MIWFGLVLGLTGSLIFGFVGFVFVLKRERDKEHKVGWVRKWGEAGRSQEKWKDWPAWP